MSGADLVLDAQTDSGLLILTLNQGDIGNPLNLDLLLKLRAAVGAGTGDPDVRAILLRSNTDRFCTGMDFSALLSNNGDDSGGAIRESIEAYSAVLAGIYNCPKPVICALSGEVRAGGVGLVCACDIVVASPESTFALTEVLFGLVPANVLPYLLGLRVSPQKARYLILSAKIVEAEEARQIGIVDEIVGRGKLNGRLRSLIRQLMRSSPDALQRAKKLAGEMVWQNLETTREAAIDGLAEIVENPDVIQGIRAFQEGSTPEWFSRFKPQIELFSIEEP